MVKEVICQTPNGAMIPLEETMELEIVNVSIEGETAILTVI